MRAVFLAVLALSGAGCDDESPAPSLASGADAAASDAAVTADAATDARVGVDATVDADATVAAGEDAGAEVLPGIEGIEGCDPLDADGDGDHECTLFHDAVERTYWLHVPDGAAPAGGRALVVNFHGYSSDGLDQEQRSRMRVVSDAEGFVTVHPEGTGLVRGWNAGACCGLASLSGIDDVGFALAIVDRVSAPLGIDPARVYAMGFSNGAFLTHRLACEAADVFAAFAPVSGKLAVECDPSRPVPILQIHGLDDRTVAYEGIGLFSGPSVPDLMAGWAERDGCATTLSTSFAEGDVTCQQYDDCPEGAAVELCTIAHFAHDWPDGDWDATAYLWAFFDAHPMP